MWSIIYRVTSYLPTGPRVHSSPHTLTLPVVMTHLGVVLALYDAGVAGSVVTAEQVIVDAFISSPDGGLASLTLAVPDALVTG